MGGHAFRHLNCPRMTPDVYFKTREHATDALRTLFNHVVVPTEMPAKPDYGDVDFLVSGFLLAPPAAELDWQRMVARTKEVLNTSHGKRGYLNPDVMYFAIPHPDEEHAWIQIDVKVCDAGDEEAFAWEKFQLHYASGLKMLGSLIKPLGLTISPTGLHIRVEEMEATNFPGSLVFVSKQPADVLKILGLDKRFLFAGFSTMEEIYWYFASTWVFNPAHYAARLEEGKYRDHLEDRSGPWVAFIKEWIPQYYPGYRLPAQDIPLEQWRTQMRVAMREKVFTMFPAITPEYYMKRAGHIKEVEEHRLQQLLMEAIPVGQDGWADGIPHPAVIIEAAPTTPPLTPTIPAQGGLAWTLDQHSDPLDIFSHPLTPPHTPPPSVRPSKLTTPTRTHPTRTDPLLTPLHLQPLPRNPPLAFAARPPPTDMSSEKKLACLARWTLFDAITGHPYLACQPREKNFSMCWSDSGASDEVLLRWAREMWWGVWVRQARVNYVGMWKRRFEKEDAKAEKERVERETDDVERKRAEQVEAEVEAKRARILERLAQMDVY